MRSHKDVKLYSFGYKFFQAQAHKQKKLLHRVWLFSNNYKLWIKIRMSEDTH